MNRFLSCAALLLMALPNFASASVGRSTLRVDCIFSGDATHSSISVSGLSDAGPWAGRNVNMDTLLFAGNGQVWLRSADDGTVLYCNSFSTLFQEWQVMEEATRCVKSFENVFLLPMPEEAAVLTIELFNHRGESVSRLDYPVDPSDILIRPIRREPEPHRYLLQSGPSSECIDLAIVAEGYTAGEAEIFYADAQAAMESIFSHAPFDGLKDRFNVVAVAPASKGSGVSVPHEGKWLDTALGSHFDTFYIERYLTTLHLFRLHDLLSGIPYEHIIILVNTDEYGGGGIFNSYLLSSAHNEWTSPVVVHEFGHSFAGLADEYFYDHMDYDSYFYFPDREPWEPNITTLADFGSKWADMMPEGAEPVSRAAQLADPGTYNRPDPSLGVGLYEGAGYQSEGVYRPYPQCRMKVNNYPSFCPVCSRAIERIIDFYTKEL